MKRLPKIIIVVLIFSCCLGFSGLAAAREESPNKIIKAEVEKVLQQEEKENEYGRKYVQQNLQLRILEGDFENRIIEINGISEVEVVANNVYDKGDILLVSHDTTEEEESFYIVDYYRQNIMILLALIFAVLIIVVGKFKGLKSLFSLAVSFAFILWVILPLIVKGYNPILVSLVGSFVILIFIIYLTEGFKKKSHLAVLSILISLAITGLLALLFTSWANLTGLDEEAMFLMGMTNEPLNFSGLLLAGIVIGTLGVLDDVVISQIVLVEELKKNNPEMPLPRVLASSYKVGVSHISSMTNTLFLAYAGASLPLLLLFTLSQGQFTSGFQVINNEQIATEIIRTLVGSIGLVLAVPISTFLATLFLKEDNKVIAKTKTSS